MKGEKTPRRFMWRNCSKMNSKLIPLYVFFKDFAKIVNTSYCILKTLDQIFFFQTTYSCSCLSGFRVSGPLFRLRQNNSPIPIKYRTAIINILNWAITVSGKETESSQKHWFPTTFVVYLWRPFISKDLTRFFKHLLYSCTLHSCYNCLVVTLD